ncbi:MAG: nucleoside-triphosphatase [Gelidibacter sp.]
MIYILTGDIRIGKTTALLQWCKTKTNVDGLLCPDDEFEKRYFFKIKSKKPFPLEVSDDSSDVITIGKFKFLKEGFKTANDYLISLAKEKASKYVIIDELGKLELKNEGLHSSAQKLIQGFQSNLICHLILVVRSSLLEEILQHYKIQEYKLISIEELSKNRLA